MKFKHRAFKVVSVFFYGYAATVGGVATYIGSSDPANFTLYNLVLFPMIGGYIAAIPQLGKMFNELAKDGSQ